MGQDTIDILYSISSCDFIKSLMLSKNQRMIDCIVYYFIVSKTSPMLQCLLLVSGKLKDF